MQYLVDEKTLFELIKDSEYMTALQQAGVDNWEHYGINFDEYFSGAPKDECGDIDVDAYVQEQVEGFPMKNGERKIKCEWREGQECYYENNRAEFVKAITYKYALIVVEAVPNIKSTGENFCAECMAGGYGTPSHTCGEAQEVIDIIQDELEDSPTMVPVTVEISKLRKKPIIVDRHEDTVKVLMKKQAEIYEKTKQLIVKNSELESQLRAREDALKQIKEIGDELGISET